jgi:hypothetical protein
MSTPITTSKQKKHKKKSAKSGGEIATGRLKPKNRRRNCNQEVETKNRRRNCNRSVDTNCNYWFKKRGSEIAIPLTPFPLKSILLTSIPSASILSKSIPLHHQFLYHAKSL